MSDESQKKILVVDDDLSYRLTLQHHLQTAGYECHLVEDGQEALQVIKQEHFSLILLDLIMPGIDGTAVLREALNIDKNNAILVLTSISDVETAQKIISSGAYGYITKPFDRQELLIRITDALHRKELEKENRKYREDLENLVRERSKQLVSSREQFKAIFSQAAIGMAQVELDGSFLQVNNKLSEITGYTVNELLGIKFPELVHPDNAQDYLALFAEGGVWKFKPHNRQERFIDKDGNLIYVISSISLVRDNQDTPEYYTVAINDISKRIEVEEEKENLHKQLLQSQKMDTVGRLAGGVAHDFNNLITIILGFSDFAMDEIDPESPLAQDIQQIKEAGLRASTLVRQLLAFSRKQVLEFHNIDLNILVKDLVKMLGRLVGENVTIQTHSAEEQSIIWGDPGQIEQVLMNLVVNARDAMPTGGNIDLTIKNCILTEGFVSQNSGAKVGPHVLLTVKDGGMGIAKEIQQNIFEPFFTTKEEGKGTGLGLATVYGIVKQHNGYIDLESDNTGTSFDLYFPMPREGDEASIDNKNEAPQGGNETILVVEDEASILSMTIKQLTSLGYNTIATTDGEKAINLVKESGDKIDVLLTDVILPGCSGVEVSKEVIKLRPEIKTIFMSGYTDDLLTPQGISTSDNIFLAKPFNKEQLAQKLRQTIESVSS